MTAWAPSRAARRADKPDAEDAAVPRRARSSSRNIRFHYGKEGGVIEDLSLTIAPGEKVGLVGRSGAGKSTLMNLLLRFYDLESGRILIDGQDIADVTQDSLRAQIGVVTQDTSLLHRSVRDNIAYGRRTPAMKRSSLAAKRANAHDFILDLEDPRGARATTPMSASAA
jgi:ATP-binding cassette subfamily B multidrug efflux pump